MTTHRLSLLVTTSLAIAACGLLVGPNAPNGLWVRNERQVPLVVVAAPDVRVQVGPRESGWATAGPSEVGHVWIINPESCAVLASLIPGNGVEGDGADGVVIGEDQDLSSGIAVLPRQAPEPGVVQQLPPSNACPGLRLQV